MPKKKKKKPVPRNPVAKHLPKLHRSVPFRDRTKYSRKDQEKLDIVPT